MRDRMLACIFSFVYFEISFVLFTIFWVRISLLWMLWCLKRQGKFCFDNLTSFRPTTNSIKMGIKPFHRRAQLNRWYVYSTDTKHLIQKIITVSFLQLLKLKKSKCIYISNQRLNRGDRAILLIGIEPLYRRACLNR